jgi:cytochrome c biogenesis protein CcmG, thiol:disulfide interchange protein DsbE
MISFYQKQNLISIFILLVSAGWIVYSSTMIPVLGSSKSIPQIGFLAPEIDLPSLSHGQKDISPIQDRVVLINFFASWCPPCKAEMPAMQRVYETYHAKGLDIFAVTNLQQDNLSDIQVFINDSGVQFPILLDRNGITFHDYALRALPTTFLLDSSGRIRKVFYGGPLTEILLSTEIEKVMKGR